jgi:hypothetical protein
LEVVGHQLQRVAWATPDRTVPETRKLRLWNLHHSTTQGYIASILGDILRHGSEFRRRNISSVEMNRETALVTFDRPEVAAKIMAISRGKLFIDRREIKVNWEF